MHFSNEWALVGFLFDETKETAVSGGRPEPALMIFKQIMDDFVGQTIALRVVLDPAFRPAAIESAE